MKRKIILPLLILALAVMACNLQFLIPTPTVPATTAPTNTPPAPTASLPTAIPATDTPVPPHPTLTAAPVTSTPGDLTLDMLKNGTYHTPFYGRNVTLVNGSFSEGSGVDAFSVRMLDVYALGDLNGDGKKDAAIILSENGGGSGMFESVIAITNQAGAPHQEDQAELGDRVNIKSVDISSGVIHLNMVVQGPNDPMCCPTLPQKHNYWLIDNKLWLMRLNSTVGGVEHLINITSPGIWTTVKNPFTVNGVVTVLPFENTLAYKIYKTDGTKVNEGTLMVVPSGGTTGTFSQPFNLSYAGISDWIILQFVDVSAADGSTTALGSVILKTH